MRLIFNFIINLLMGCASLVSLENENLTIEEKYQIYAHRLHPHSYHHPQRHKKQLIQLKNNSIWFIHPDDREKISTWKKKHEIFIKPAYSCFWSDFFIVYNYILYNRSLNEIIAVKLDSSRTISELSIIQIDPSVKTIMLNDHTTWVVDALADLSQWQEGNTVIVGVNNRWYDADYPQILINISIAGSPHVQTLFLSLGS